MYPEFAELTPLLPFSRPWSRVGGQGERVPSSDNQGIKDHTQNVFAHCLFRCWTLRFRASNFQTFSLGRIPRPPLTTPVIVPIETYFLFCVSWPDPHLSKLFHSPLLFTLRDRRLIQTFDTALQRSSTNVSCVN